MNNVFEAPGEGKMTDLRIILLTFIRTAGPALTTNPFVFPLIFYCFCRDIVCVCIFGITSGHRHPRGSLGVHDCLTSRCLFPIRYPSTMEQSPQPYDQQNHNPSAYRGHLLLFVSGCASLLLAVVKCIIMCHSKAKRPLPRGWAPMLPWQ